MPAIAFVPDFGPDLDPALSDADVAPRGAGALVPETQPAALAAIVEAPELAASPAVVAPPDEAPEQDIGVQDLWVAAGPEDRVSHVPAPQAPTVHASAMEAAGIDAAQILNDRPDVFRAFFTEFYGPNNDHHSRAWMDRVGGDTPEAYAKFWYDKMGGAFSYTPTQPHGAAPATDDPLPATGPDEIAPPPADPVDTAPAADAPVADTPEAHILPLAAGPDDLDPEAFMTGRQLLDPSAWVI